MQPKTPRRHARFKLKNLRGQSILVIDDVPFYLPYYAKALIQLDVGYEFLKNLDDACEWIHRNKPKLILVNNEMLGSDTKRIHQNLQNHPELKDTPLVIMTNERHEGAVERFLDYGATHFMMKHELNDPHRFAETLSKLIEYT